MEAGAASRQPLGSQQIRIAALVVVAVVVGVVLWLVLGNSNKNGQKVYHAIGPETFSAKNLAAESRFINTKFFWAGKKKGLRYEFTRLTNGFIYVRYLTKGAPIGNFKQAKFLVVATYPRYFTAYSTLKKSKRSVAGPDHSVILQRRKDRRSVLMAFKGVPDEIEVYAPNGATALATASSGDIRPVRG